MTTVDSNLVGFHGGFATSTHAYYAPHTNAIAGWHGNVVRISLSDFSSSGVEHFDLTTIDADLKYFSGGFATSTHAYYVPRSSSTGHKVARISLSDFSSSGVDYFDLTTINSALKGFMGGFATSTHAYVAPNYNGNFHGNAVRFRLN